MEQSPTKGLTMIDILAILCLLILSCAAYGFVAIVRYPFRNRK